MKINNAFYTKSNFSNSNISTSSSSDKTLAPADDPGSNYPLTTLSDFSSKELIIPQEVFERIFKNFDFFNDKTTARLISRDFKIAVSCVIENVKISHINELKLAIEAFGFGWLTIIFARGFQFCTDELKDVVPYPKITGLDFSECQDDITGNNPEFIKQCTNLRELKFSDAAGLTGIVLNKLPHPERLEELGLFRDDGLVEGGFENFLARCSNLRKLNLSNYGYFTGKLLNSLPHPNILEEVNFSGFGTLTIEELQAFFARCDNLQKLTLGSGFPLTSEILNSFPYPGILEEINFSESGNLTVEELQAFFARCGKLRKLNLGSGFYITNEVLNNLPHPERLEELDLYYCSGHADGEFKDFLARCSNLRKLNFGSDFYITGDELNKLSQLEKLEELRLSKSHITLTKENLKDSFSQFRNLQKLKLEFNFRVTNDALNSLPHPEKLEGLELAYLAYEDLLQEKFQAFLARCGNLQKLNLPNYERFTSDVLDSLLHPEKLEELNLSGKNLFTIEEIQIFLGRCSNVRKLKVGGSDYYDTHALLDNLPRLEKLEDLELSRYENYMNGALLAKLARFPNLQRLTFGNTTYRIPAPTAE